MNYDLFISPAVADSTRAMPTSHGMGQAASAVRSSRPVFQDDAAIATPRGSASEPLTTEEITNAVAAFNDVFEQADVSVRYRIDDATKDLVISLVDAHTDEVLRQWPPEAILKMRQRLEELLGLVFDVTA